MFDSFDIWRIFSVNCGELRRSAVIYQNPGIDTNLLTKNDSSTDNIGVMTKGDIEDNMLITPPIDTENNIDCSIASASFRFRLRGYRKK